MEHLTIDKIKIQEVERRKRRGFGTGIPVKDYAQQGMLIDQSINDAIQKSETKSKQFNFNPYLVMKIQLEDDVKFTEDEEEKLNLYGLKIIDKESKELQVVFSEDTTLHVFREQLDKYQSGEVAKTKVVDEDLFNKIKAITEWGPEDRIGYCEDNIKNGSYLDVYLWVFEQLEISRQKTQEFINDLRQFPGAVCDSYVGKAVVVVRLRIVDNVIEAVLHHPLVYKVESMLRCTVVEERVKNIREVPVDSIIFDNSLLDDEVSSSICVIDSGIYQQHPLLKGVVGDSKTFYLTDGQEDTSDDMVGHGTAVASICEYGDFEYTDKFIPKIYLHNAKIHNGEYDDPINLWKIEVENEIGSFQAEQMDQYFRFIDGDISVEQLIDSFEERQQPYLRMVYNKYSSMYERLIPNQMRDIVEYFYKNYGCRIYNLSQGNSEQVFNDGRPRAWACVLDELQNEFDILFIVSAGNYRFDCFDEYELIEEEYPGYFLKKEHCKIIEPANSINSLTVGALAVSDEVYTVPANRTKRHSISKLNQLATLTRVGPGVRGGIKPDFVAYGGDRGINIDIMGRKKPLDNNEGLSKLLFNNDDNGLFRWACGTSFAAPYISHIAANIMEKYPNASNNLVRAILANGSTYPGQLIEDINELVDKTREARSEFTHNVKGKIKNNLNKILHYTAGYGFPVENICLDSSQARVALMADMVGENSIKVDEVNVFRIPLVEEFRKVKGEKRVTVSLAHNPRVRSSRLEYLGVNMEFKLIKGESQEKVIEMYRSRSQGGRDESPTGECPMFPGTNLRSNGTLQKAVYTFKRDSGFQDEDLYLVVNCKKVWDIEPQQYAVVVTLECQDSEINLYTKLKQRLQQRETTQVRV